MDSSAVKPGDTVTLKAEAQARGEEGRCWVVVEVIDAQVVIRGLGRRRRIVRIVPVDLLVPAP